MVKTMFMLETLFLFSLGITFLLILLLIYHFKNRLAGMEQKHEVLLDIMNSLVQETHMIKSVMGNLWRPPTSNFPESVVFRNIPANNLVEPSLEEDDDDEDDEDVVEEDDEDVDDEDVDDDDAETLEELELEEEQEVFEQTKVDAAPQFSLEDLNQSANWQAMKIPELRALVVQRGLTTDASKMKKPQLLALLGNK